MFPTNSTGLSLAGILKWLAILFSCGTAFMGGQALVTKQAMRDRSTVVYGAEAQLIGIKTLGISLAFATAAFCLWFFWQRHED